MSTEIWLSGVSGNWTTGSDWTTGSPPTGADAVLISTNGTYTITLNTAGQSAASVTLDAPNAELDLQYPGDLSISGAFTLKAGELLIDSGTLSGGTLIEQGGVLGITYNGNNDFSGVAVQGDLTYSGGYLVFTNGSTVSGAINLSGGSALELRGYSDLVNNVTLTSGVLTGSRSGGVADTLTVDSGVTVQGYGTIDDNAQSLGTISIDNKGTINANVSGQTLYIYPATFTNDGLAEATNGGTLYIDYGQQGNSWTNAADGTVSATSSTLDLGGSFTNAGTISETGGTLNLGDSSNVAEWHNTGTITTNGTAIYLRGNITTADVGTITRTAGSLTAYDAINNASATVDTTQGTFKDLMLDSGSITGGTVVTGATDSLAVSGNGGNTLSGVTVDGGLALTTGYLVLNNGTKIEDSSGSTPAAISLSSSSLELDGYSDIVNDITLTNGTLYATGFDAATNHPYSFMIRASTVPELYWPVAPAIRIGV